MTVCAAYPNCTGPSRGCKCLDDRKRPEPLIDNDGEVRELTDEDRPREDAIASSKESECERKIKLS